MDYLKAVEMGISGAGAFGTYMGLKRDKEFHNIGFKESINIANQHHYESMHTDFAIAKSSLKFSRQLHLEQMRVSYLLHMQQLYHDMRSSKTESERDMTEQKLEEMQAVMLCSSILIAGVFSVTVDGDFPTTASLFELWGFVVCSALSFAFLIGSIYSALYSTRQYSDQMFQSALRTRKQHRAFLRSLHKELSTAAGWQSAEESTPLNTLKSLGKYSESRLEKLAKNHNRRLHAMESRGEKENYEEEFSDLVHVSVDPFMDDPKPTRGHANNEGDEFTVRHSVSGSVTSKPPQKTFFSMPSNDGDKTATQSVDDGNILSNEELFERMAEERSTTAVHYFIIGTVFLLISFGITVRSKVIGLEFTDDAITTEAQNQIAIVFCAILFGLTPIILLGEQLLKKYNISLLTCSKAATRPPIKEELIPYELFLSLAHEKVSVKLEKLHSTRSGFSDSPPARKKLYPSLSFSFPKRPTFRRSKSEYPHQKPITVTTVNKSPRQPASLMKSNVLASQIPSINASTMAQLNSSSIPERKSNSASSTPSSTDPDGDKSNQSLPSRV